MSVALPRVASRSVVVSVLAVGLWLGVAGRAQADPLNPLDFTSLGAFPTTPGGYTINTSGTPTLTGPGGTIDGVVYQDMPDHSLAVFDFESISVVRGENISAVGALAPVLLSRADATIAGTIDVSASGSTGGPGGYPGSTFGGLFNGPGGGGGGGSAEIAPTAPPWPPEAACGQSRI